MILFDRRRRSFLIRRTGLILLVVARLWSEFGMAKERSRWVSQFSQPHQELEIAEIVIDPVVGLALRPSVVGLALLRPVAP